MKLLIVEDDKDLRLVLVKTLEKAGWEVKTAENALAAQRFLGEETFDLVLLDLRLPGTNGLELLEWIQGEGLSPGVVMMSAHGQVQEAVQALKTGALDYLSKPFEPEELIIRLTSAYDLRTFRRKPAPAAQGSDDPISGFPSPTFQKIRNLVTKVAPSPSLVLITGESGTGKEVLARSIHAASPWKSGPFVAVNIGGLPETLLESELFGYEKGAFTGADRRKIGFFEAAQGGTLFLDEIGEMPLSLQVKILRVLQERRIQRLGGISGVPVEARILCATNRDLKEEVKAGRFREDLFYRLNVVPIALPPLRDRKEDLPELCRRILERLSVRGGKNFTVNAAGMKALVSYSFPGNIRELENLLERACIFAEGPELQPQDLDLPQGPLPLLPPAPGSLAEVEKRAVETALLRWEHNQTKAAEELGISRRTLFNKLKEYGLEAGSGS